MDTGERFCKHRTYAEIERHQRRMLARGALAVVFAANHYAAAVFFAVFGKVLVAHAEAELRQIRYVGAVGQYLGAGRHYMVGRNIVAHLEHHRALQTVGQRLGLREGLYVGPAEYLNVVVLRRGRVDHVVVYQKPFGKLYLSKRRELARIGKYAGQRCSGGRFGAYEVNACVGRARTAQEVAVEGPQRNAARVGRLAHAYAGTAGTFEYPCAGGDKL